MPFCSLIPPYNPHPWQLLVCFLLLSRISCKQDYTVHNLSILTYFTKYSAFCILFCIPIICPFLFLSSISLYGQTTVCSSVNHLDVLGSFQFFGRFIFKIYFWLCWVFNTAWAFLQLWQVEVTLVAVHRCLIALVPLVAERWLWSTRTSVVVARGQSSCSCRTPEHRLSHCEHGLSCSVVCGIFLDQGSNLCPCISRRILIHCIMREVLFFFKF